MLVNLLLMMLRLFWEAAVKSFLVAVVGMSGRLFLSHWMRVMLMSWLNFFVLMIMRMVGRHFMRVMNVPKRLLENFEPSQELVSSCLSVLSLSFVLF